MPNPETEQALGAPVPRRRRVLYRPNMRHELGFFQTWVVMSRNVWGVRELIWQLFKRGFFAACRKSFIGYAWIVITPIMGIVS